MNKLYAIAFIGLLTLSSFGATAFVAVPQLTEGQDIPQSTAFDDGLDQYMDDCSEEAALPVGRLTFEDITIYSTVAQSFVPQTEVLTRAEIYIRRNSTTSSDFTVSIREELTGDNLAEVSLPSSEIVEENFSWVEFDFEDTPVNIGETYYLVGHTENITDNWYLWLGNTSDLYPEGCAWMSLDDGDTWSNDSYAASDVKLQPWYTPQSQALGGPRANDSMDMCFKTYGRQNLPPSIPTIDGPIEGKAGEDYDYVVSSTDPEGEEVYYWIEWFEGCPGVDWQGPYSSGDEITFNNTWPDRGTYVISVKAKDASGHETEWATLEVTMPKDASSESMQKTFVCGYVRFVRMRPSTISFRAVRVRYRYIGEGEYGVYKHQGLTFDNNYMGRIGSHWVCAIFDGKPM